MYRFLLAVLTFFITWHDGRSQSTGQSIKFKDFVFETVRVQKDLVYADTVNSPKHYRFNWYEPSGDTTRFRPLIIWLHGGGFKFGKKTSGGLTLWSKTFARRGYVCAAINYRLSKKHPLKNYADLVEGCADAVEDVQTAIRYFKQHYLQLRIDTTHILLGGNSAGGMIALQAVYSSGAEMAQLVHQGASAGNDARLHNPEKVVAIINCWGALFDIKWLQNARVPVVSIHGKKDRVVPFAGKAGIYGSEAIHRAADSLHIPNALKVYDDYAHELQKHFNPLFAGAGAKKRWAEAGVFAASFLYDELFRAK